MNHNDIKYKYLYTSSTSNRFTIDNVKQQEHCDCCYCREKRNSLKEHYDYSEGNSSDCLHDGCPECNGTGRKKRDGSMCIHMIACTCRKCTIWC